MFWSKLFKPELLFIAIALIFTPIITTGQEKSECNEKHGLDLYMDYSQSYDTKINHIGFGFTRYGEIGVSPHSLNVFIDFNDIVPLKRTLYRNIMNIAAGISMKIEKENRLWVGVDVGTGLSSVSIING